MKCMNFARKDLNREEISILPVFIASAAVACILIMIQGSDLLLRTDVLDEGTLKLMNYQKQDCKSLFVYVLKERWGIIPLLFVISTTHLALYAVYGMLVWYGTACGALLGVAVLRYGFGGILLIMVSGLPQYLLYVPAVVAALRLSMRQRVPDKKFILQMLILEMVVIIGCILESYVNLMLVEKFLKIF